MSPQLLQPQLRLPYYRATWIPVLRDLFANPEILLQPVEVPLTNQQERAIATARRQFGGATLADGRRIAFFEVDVVPRGVDLFRNRVALRRLVARCIDETSAHAVLAFFVQPGRDDFRLTYAARESTLDESLAVHTRETATRRFTYVLGPGGTRRTAALRLAALSERSNAALADVTDAFSVEKLNREFFDSYKRHYETFCRHLIEETAAAAQIFGLSLDGLEGKARERALKPVRDFVKKLLGRIVFLHFLQKKGWLGCPALPAAQAALPQQGVPWEAGDAEFLRTLFAEAPEAEKVRFHSARLVPLFFDTLNDPARPGHRFAVTGTRVPYLNGGLFERDFDGVEQIDFPASFWSTESETGLLDFLAHYHFTIDENDPEDHEIGIDPEMLGHIFENLLEDNKDKGAYYTPKAVVQYMCQQSLIHALAGHFPGDPAARGEIERLIRTKEPIDARDAQSWLTGHATRLATLLDELRICDPAIGSGAFPIALLQEIYWTQLALSPRADRARLKRDIIQRSIHGVDLDAGAVEIARLRFWLALIVEESTPVPLPNLDYQIMQGNSLLESFEGVDLSKLNAGVRPGHSVTEVLGDPQGQLLADEARSQLELGNAARRDEISALLREYFGIHRPEDKAAARARIDRLAVEHIRYNLGYTRDALETQLQQHRETLAGRRVRPPRWREAACRRSIASLEGELAELSAKETRLRELEHKPERPFFLWHLWFRHILAAPPEGRGGFDIVIANPPYGAEIPACDAPTFRAEFETLANSLDSFIVFMEQATRLLRARGALAFIIPCGWVSTPSSRKLRALFARTYRPQIFASLPYDVFGEAYVDTMIVVATKLGAAESWDTITDKTVNLVVFPVRYRIAELANFDRFYKTSNFGLWGDPGSDGFLVTSTVREAELVAKIRALPRKFDDFVEVMRGIEAYNPQAVPPPQHSKRAFVGEIYRYEVNHTERGYLSYPPDIENRKPWRFFSGPRVLLRQLLSRKFRLQAGYTEDEFLTNQSVQSLLARDEAAAPIKVLLRFSIRNSSRGTSAR